MSDMTITITVMAPDKYLNSNDRLHRMAQAKLTKQWRNAAEQASHGFMPMKTPVHIVAHVWKKRAGRYDVGNLYPTAKACVDGFVDGGIFADDSNEYVLGPDLRHGGKGEPHIIFTIAPIETRG